MFLSGAHRDRGGIFLPDSSYCLFFDGPQYIPEIGSDVATVAISYDVFDGLDIPYPYITGISSSCSLHIESLSYTHVIGFHTPSFISYCSTSGILSISNCTFQSSYPETLESISSVSFIFVNQTSASFYTTHFHNMEATAGDGGAISMNISGGKMVMVEGCNFTNCSAVERGSRGGAICVTLCSRGVLVVKGTSAIPSAFVMCHAGAAVGVGGTYDGLGGGIFLALGPGFELKFKTVDDFDSKFSFEGSGLKFEGNGGRIGDDICM
jgi:hypothetical protein